MIVAIDSRESCQRREHSAGVRSIADLLAEVLAGYEASEPEGIASAVPTAAVPTAFINFESATGAGVAASV